MRDLISPPVPRRPGERIATSTKYLCKWWTSDPGLAGSTHLARKAVTTRTQHLQRRAACVRPEVQRVH